MLVMRTLRHVAVLSSALVLLGAVGFAAWLYSLPPMPPAASPASVPEGETRAATTALAQPRRPRPLVAIIGINDATETTDYLMPYGILRRADVADVVALATSAGPMRLYPALKVQPQATIAQFDARHPQGADYVIVPAMSRDDDPAAIRWIRAQAAKGATVIGVCAGAKVVASAGLLDGRRATTHWYYLDGMLARHPSIRHAPDRRFVIDRGVATTTGVTASMPMTLTLIEAIAGRTKAQEVAHDLGLPHWDARHDSSAFVFNRAFALTALGNRLAFWKHEQLGLELAPGIDEVTLALVADAWSRTYRSRALSFASTPGARRTAGGLSILPDRIAADWPARQRLPPIGTLEPAPALDRTLQDIRRRYGADTARFVAMQLEYPDRELR
jgi:putative intracellular protease/amidase